MKRSTGNQTCRVVSTCVLASFSLNLSTQNEKWVFSPLSEPSPNHSTKHQTKYCYCGIPQHLVSDWLTSGTANCIREERTNERTQQAWNWYNAPSERHPVTEPNLLYRTKKRRRHSNKQIPSAKWRKPPNIHTSMLMTSTKHPTISSQSTEATTSTKTYKHPTTYTQRETHIPSSFPIQWPPPSPPPPPPPPTVPPTWL